MNAREAAEQIVHACGGDPKRINDARAIIELVKSEVVAEREACARIASGMATRMDCDDRGTQDPETGEVPCDAERRGEVCVCSERSELAFKIADKIRARPATTV